ncbi:3-hydroxyacyl-CoA dehydrogenase [Acidocella aquatica]|uniref:3-hydroxyacyl-CoA dehydrogenase n=1 Tax=Acidocella aquatica TaxID=1922313 RepID=A0ABQ6AA79_9PROT|nr:SDR family NAD(P)-dependent oxidoreductase [Acidocella aquatica]GLR67034.1 3-hydroxyacyl-CoA dehydrogenase [Acidocella aquatica]
MSGLLEGRVIIVTGGGRGVGRGIALNAASQGARVIVNDIGIGPGGEVEGGTGPACDVVDEIKAAGGEAAACYDSVSTWASAQKIIQSALDNFGRIDGVVNNAGILKDTIFHKMPIEDFDQVIDVNLKGVFYVSRAAAPYFKEQSSGAFVHMTSTSALIGNFGQVNYIAAKAGVAGMSRAIALDMQRFGVTSNAIAPFAWTRMVNTIPTDTPEQKKRVEGLKKMIPEKIAPFVVALLSDEGRKRVNGQIFGVRNNEIFFFSQTRPIQIAQNGDGWTPETVIERAFPMFEPHFYPLVRSGEVFSWDPC